MPPVYADPQSYESSTAKLLTRRPPPALLSVQTRGELAGCPHNKPYGKVDAKTFETNLARPNKTSSGVLQECTRSLRARSLDICGLSGLQFETAVVRPLARNDRSPESAPECSKYRRIEDGVSSTRRLCSATPKINCLQKPEGPAIHCHQSGLNRKQ